MSKAIVSLRAEGTSEVLAALKSVRQERDAMELLGVAAAKKASAARLSILRDEVNKSKALRSELAKDDDAGGRGGGGSGGKGGGGGNGGGPSAWGIAGAAEVLKRGLDIASDALKKFRGFVLNDVIRPAMVLQTRAQQVANASGGKLSADEVLGQSRAVAIKNNMDPGELMNAAGVFQDATGDSKMSFEMLNIIGTLSKARGFDPSQLAGMAGAVYKQGMSTGDLEKILLMQTAQGDMGSVTLGETAKLGGKLTAPAGHFAGDYATRIAMSGALLQSSRRGFGSTDEAATGLASFTTDALKAGKAFSPTAIIKDKSGVEQITDPAKLIGDIFRKNSGNATALRAAGFSDPSMKLIGSYQERFSEAHAAARAGGASDEEAKKAAATAVEDFIKTFVAANTTMAAESAKRDAVMQTSGERFETATNKIKDRLTSGLMPSVDRFATILDKNADDIADVVTAAVQAMLFVLEKLGLATAQKEGDTVATVADKGADTELKNPAGAVGYWRKGEGKFDFIKNDTMTPGDEANGKWITVGKNGMTAFQPNAPPPQPIGAPTAAQSDFEKGLREAKSPLEAIQALGKVSEAVAEPSSPLDAAASDTSSKLKLLGNTIDDLAGKMKELNRTGAFGSKG
jgi:hypothetical protein